MEPHWCSHGRARLCGAVREPGPLTLVMNFLQMGRISLDRVALNIMTCFSCGVILKMSCRSPRMSAQHSPHLPHVPTLDSRMALAEDRGERAGVLYATTPKEDKDKDILGWREHRSCPASCHTRPAQSVARCPASGRLPSQAACTGLTRHECQPLLWFIRGGVQAHP